MASPIDPSDWPTFLSLIQTGGVGVTGLLAWLLWKEMRDHRETRGKADSLQQQAKLDAAAVTREVVGVIHTVTAAVEKIGDSQEQTRETMQKIADAVTALSSRRR